MKLKPVRSTTTAPGDSSSSKRRASRRGMVLRSHSPRRAITTTPSCGCSTFAASSESSATLRPPERRGGAAPLDRSTRSLSAPSPNGAQLPWGREILKWWIAWTCCCAREPLGLAHPCFAEETRPCPLAGRASKLSDGEAGRNADRVVESLLARPWVILGLAPLN